MKSFKDLKIMLARISFKGQEIEKDLYRDEDAGLPKEHQLNIFSALGCLVFLFAIMFINILILIFFRI